MKKIIVYVTILGATLLFAYEEKCYFQEPKTMNRRVIANKNDIRNRATYIYTNKDRQETCYVALEDREKQEVIAQLQRYKDKELANTLIEEFPNNSITKKVVFDFVTHKTKERNKSGALFVTVENVLDVINPQGDQKPLTGLK